MARPLALTLVTILLAAPLAHAAVFCASKKGALHLRDTCKAKETTVDAAAVGLQGAKGDKGDQGDPGTGLVTMADTVGPVGLGGSYTAVASTNSADAPETSGAWYGALTNPSSSGVFMVTAHVKSDVLSGTLDCLLEASADGGSYYTLANGTAPGLELFMNHTFPAFTAGMAFQFRVSCRVTGGSRNVDRATIGAIASIANLTN